MSAGRRALVKNLLIAATAAAAFVVAAFAGAIAFGGPSTPPPLAFVRDATVARDRGDLPAIRHYRARDGAQLTYRAHQTANPIGAAILIHGSVGSSADVHEIAKAIRAAGIDAYAPDMRGHGVSGPRGDIAYIGQLEDDLSDFLADLDRQGVPARRVLLGHSVGGGFALRVAAQPLGARFAGMILLAPYLGADAPTTKPSVGAWVGVGVPRIVALTILDELGIHVFGGLPALAFAVSANDAQYVTPAYSYRLFANFGPHRDWRHDIASAHGPLVILAGDADQMFDADRYKATFAAASNARVEILPSIDHMSITGSPSALKAIAEAATELLRGDRH